MTNNPFMKRVSAQTTGTSGRVSEKRMAKGLGGLATPGSGAMRGAKSDIRLKKERHKFQVECKSTKALTLPVDLGWLVKISEEAAATGSVPALTLSFTDAEGKARPKGDWVAVPLWFFEELISGD